MEKLNNGMMKKNFALSLRTKNKLLNIKNSKS